MKKKFITLLASMMIFSLTACSTSNPEPASENSALTNVSIPSEESSSLTDISTSSDIQESSSVSSTVSENHLEILTNEEFEKIKAVSNDYVETTMSENGEAAFVRIEGGGMYKLGMSPYFTTDGGKTWIHGEDFQMSSSSRISHSLDHQRILIFFYSWVAMPDQPGIYVLTFDYQNFKVKTEYLREWYSMFDIDGVISMQSEYKGDYTLHMTIRRAANPEDDNRNPFDQNQQTGDILFNGDVILEPETLYPKELKET